MRKFLAVIALLIVGCTQTPPPEEPQVQEEPKEEVVVQLVCVDENDELLRCNSNSDCCEGFICVRDPAIGHKVKTCIQDLTK